MVTIKKFGDLEYRVSKAGNHATVVALDTTIDLTTGFSNTRVAFVRVPIKLIDAALQQIKNAIAKGTARVAVHDYAKDDADIIRAFGVSEEFPLEVAVKPYVRMSGENGIALTCKGQPIIRKGIFDEHGTIADVIIQHDNFAEIAAHRTAAKAAAKVATPATPAVNLAEASVTELPVNE